MKYILKIAPELKDKTNKALICLTYRLLQKYNFVLRRPSHIGQRLPLDYENKITVFLKDTISKRKELNIDEKNLHLLVNTDETPVFFDAPFYSTIDQKGKKDIKIQTAGYEKERISVILACNAIGEKLPPLVIFKGVPGKRIEKDLSKNALVKNKKLYALCQPNSWCTSDIFKFWLKEIYIKYQLSTKKKCLLIYDQAPSHKNDEIIAYMNNNNLNYLFIPAGLTSKLQPLDISVNKVFKNSYKKKYTEYVVTQSENFFNGVKKPSREDILNWINEICPGKILFKKLL